MGNSQSVDPSHVRIFKSLQEIQNPATKVQMIQTLLAGQEYVISARKVGIYADLLNFVAQHSNKAPPVIQQPSMNTTTQLVQAKEKRSHIERVGKANSDEKAIGYFQACLEVLGLQEEVALTEDILKSAYKKSVLRNHPDKGGSEKEFEKVTRAYAYLGEILKRIHGGRSTTTNVDAPNVLKDSRSKDYETVKHIEPVRLNPKKLDVDAFNKMFEETRIPDPEEDGYGDWLKSEKEDGSSSTKFSGKFNRDVFNKVFEDDAKTSSKNKNYIIHEPQSMIMAPSLGIELGRDKPDSFTSAYDSDIRFTDLKQAYTIENTISKQVAHVNVSNRDYESYKNDYGKAPPPLTNEELERVQQGEKYLQQREEQRRRRAAEEEISVSRYFERMKQLVITDNTKT